MIRPVLPLLIVVLLGAGQAWNPAAAGTSSDKVEQEQYRLLRDALECEDRALDHEAERVQSNPTRAARVENDRELMKVAKDGVKSLGRDNSALGGHLPAIDRYLYDFGRQKLRDEYPMEGLRDWSDANRRFLASGDLSVRDEALKHRDQSIASLRGLIPVQQMIATMRANGALPEPARDRFLALVGGPRTKTPRAPPPSSAASGDLLSILASLGIDPAAAGAAGLFGPSADGKPPTPGGLGSLFGPSGPANSLLPPGASIPIAPPKGATPAPVVPGLKKPDAGNVAEIGNALKVPKAAKPPQAPAPSPGATVESAPAPSGELPRLDGVETPVMELKELDRLLQMLNARGG